MFGVNEALWRVKWVPSVRKKRLRSLESFRAGEVVAVCGG